MKAHHLLLGVMLFSLLAPAIVHARMIDTKTADNFKVDWDLKEEGLSYKVYDITVKSLDASPRYFDLAVILSDVDFDSRKATQFSLYEMQDVQKTYYSTVQNLENTTCTASNGTYACMKDNPIQVQHSDTVSEPVLKTDFMSMWSQGQGGRVAIGRQVYQVGQKRDFLLYIQTPLGQEAYGKGQRGKIAIWNEYPANENLGSSVEYHPWFNTSFTNRQNISVQGVSNNTAINYQVLLNVSKAANMKVDYGDLRFTWLNSTSGLEQEVPFYLWHTKATYADVFVVVPTINATNSTLFVYYNNPLASTTSSGQKTFDLFDDFSGSFNSTLWNCYSTCSYFFQRNGVLNTSASSGANTHLGSTLTFGRNFTVYYNASMDTSQTFGNWFGFIDSTFVGGTTFDFMYGSGGARPPINILTDNSPSQTSTGTSAVTNKYSEFKLGRVKPSSTSCVYTGFTTPEVQTISDGSCATQNMVIIASDKDGNGALDTTQNNSMDYIFVAKSISPEPVASFGTEESLGSASQMLLFAFNTKNSSSISSFTATITNGTASQTNSTSSGVIIFYDPLPTGSVTATVFANDFVSTTQNLGAVNNTTTVNVFLYPAGLTLFTFDERSNGALIFNLTLANSTTSTTFNNVFHSIDFEFPNASLPKGSVTASISASDYFQRDYPITITSTTYTNLTTYLLKNTDGTAIRVHANTISGSGIPNTLITANRTINGISTTVATRLTDGTGTAGFFLDPFATYLIKATTPDNQTQSASVIPNQPDIFFTFGTSFNTGSTGIYNDTTITMTPIGQVVFIHSPTIFNCTVVSILGNQQFITLNVTINNTLSLANLSSTNPFGDQLVTSQDLTAYVGSYVTQICKFKRVNRNIEITNITYTIASGNYSSVSLAGIFDRIRTSGGDVNMVNNLSFIALFVSILMAGAVARFSTTGGAVVALIVLGMFTALGWFNAGIFTILIILALAIIILRGVF